MTVPQLAYKRGVVNAAAIASQYDKLSVHDHLVSDIILCKLNAVKRVKPRKNKHASFHFLKGFALALADMNRGHDQPSMVVDVMNSAGVTIKELRKAGIETYDIDEIEQCFHK